MVVPSSATPHLIIPGMEVIAIDVSDGVGRAEASTTTSAVEFRSLPEFVASVIAWTRGGAIGLLHVQVHGNSQGMWFGPDMLDLGNFRDVYRGSLSLLAPYLARGGYVHLRACDVGQNVTLLQNLAAAWQVTVVAGTGPQDNLPILDVNWGRYVTVTPGARRIIHFSSRTPSSGRVQSPGRCE